MKARLAVCALAAAFAVPVLGQEVPHFHTVTAKSLKWTDTPLIAGGKVAVIEGPLDKAAPFVGRDALLPCMRQEQARAGLLLGTGVAPRRLVAGITQPLDEARHGGLRP